MSCGCGLSVCYVCHKKKEACACHIAGDSEDEEESSSTVEESAFAKIFRLIIDFMGWG